MAGAPTALPRLEQENLELRRALEKHVRVVQALVEVGATLGSTGDVDELLGGGGGGSSSVNNVAEALGVERVVLYLLDEAKDELVSRVTRGDVAAGIRVKVGSGIAGAVAAAGEALRLEHTGFDSRLDSASDDLAGAAGRSVLAVPIRNQAGLTLGVIEVHSWEEGYVFSSYDESLLTALSSQASVAIEYTRLFLAQIEKNKQLLDVKQQLENRLRDLSLLFELEQATVRAESIEDLVRAILGKIMAACDARGGSVLLIDEESGDLIQYVLGRAGDELSVFHPKSGEGLLASALAEQKELVVSDVRGAPEFSRRIEGQFPFPVTSALALVLTSDTNQVGAIGLFSKARGPFGEDDRALMRLVGANAATAIRLFEAQLQRERSQRLTSIGRLLSQVVHDFKTPMTVISGYVQLMQQASEPELRQAYGAEILKQFEALTAMQRQVLQFARGEQAIFIRKVCLGPFFETLKKQIELFLGGRAGVELLFEVDGKLVAYVDEEQLARAILNLARNSLDALGEVGGGRLTVVAEGQGEALSIQVADTGPGVPPEIRAKLFRSFVTSGKQGGTGLGLAIVKKIAEQHGGSVRLLPTRRGACFELLLPNALKPPSAPYNPGVAAPEGSRRNPGPGESVKP